MRKTRLILEVHHTPLAPPACRKDKIVVHTRRLHRLCFNVAPHHMFRLPQMATFTGVYRIDVGWVRPLLYRLWVRLCNGAATNV